MKRDELLDVVWRDAVVSDASLSTAIKDIRKSLGDRATSPVPFIRTFARRGYRFVEAVQAEPAATSVQGPGGIGDAAADGDATEERPAGVTSAPEVRGGEVALVESRPPDISPQLAGRERELAMLEQRRREVLQGMGGATLILGEPGIGKTALAEQEARVSQAVGLRVLRARCERIPGSPALWPFVQLLRQLSPAPPPNTVGPAELRQRLQAAGVGAVPVEAHADNPALARFEWFESLMQVITDAGRETPLLVIIEDLHWADPSSLELLSWMISRLDALRLWLLCTARPAGSKLAETFGASEEITLSRLSTAASESLVTGLASELPGDVVQTIVAASGGHPLTLRELVRSAQREARSGHLSAQAFARNVPRTLSGLIGRRLANVSLPCRRLLGLCACIGADADEVTIAALLDEHTDTVRPLLQEAARAGLLARDAHGSGRYRFDHALLSAAVSQTLTHEERSQFHSRIAALIERRHGHDGAVAEMIMHHYRAAQNTEKVVRYAREASAQAAAVGAHETAEAHLNALPSALREPSLIDPAGRVEMLLQRARSRAALGASAEELRSIYRRAFSLGRDLASPALMAQAALGFAGCELFRGTGFSAFPASREETRLLESARAAQAEHSVWRVLVEARLGVALSTTDRIMEGQRLTESAVAMATAMGDARTLCEALLQHCRALSGPGQAGARAEAAEEALSLATRSEFVGLAKDAGFELASARLRLGALTAAELQALSGSATASPDPVEQLRGSYWSIMHALLAGRVGDAERHIDAAETRAQTTNPIAAERLFPAFRNEVDRLRGKRTAIRSAETIEVTRYKPATWMGFYWLFALLETGRLKSARAVYAMLMRTLDQLTPNQYYLPALGVGSWAAMRFEDSSGAREIYQRLAPYDGEVVTGADGLLVYGTVAHYLGAAATVMGEYGRAREHFACAQAQNRQLGAEAPALTTRLAEAHLLAKEGSLAMGRREQAAVFAEMRARGLPGLIDESGAPQRDVHAS